MIKGKYRTEIVNEALADKAAYLCDSAKTTTASRKKYKYVALYCKNKSEDIATTGRMFIGNN